jgi:acyl dehydratase
MGLKIRWKEWEDITITDWEDAGEFEVTRDFNDGMCGALEDESPWYRDGSPFGHPVVNPGAMAQAALLLMVDQQYGMEEKPEQATLHAQQDSIFHRPLKVGEKLRVRSRVAEKYERRNKKWVVYEAEFLSPKGEPVYFYRQVRMIRDETPAGAGRAR